MGKALCTDLPIELWDLILDKLDPTLDSKSLAAYSLTSRVASNLARPRLFSTTRIPVGGDNNNNRFPLFQRFALATLTVCQHIRQLELYQGSDAFRDGKLSDIVDVDELYNVLPAFPSLRMLNLNNISLASTSMRLYDKPAMIYLDHLIITSHRYHNKENYYHEPCPAVIIPCAFSLFKSLGTLEIRGLSVISCRCPSVNADAGGPWHSDAYFRKLFAVHRIGEFDIRKLVLPHPLYEFPMLYLAKALLNGGVDSLADVAMSTGDPRDIEVYCELMNENSRSLASFALEVGTWREYEGFESPWSNFSLAQCTSLTTVRLSGDIELFVMHRLFVLDAFLRILSNIHLPGLMDLTLELSVWCPSEHLATFQEQFPGAEEGWNFNALRRILKQCTSLNSLTFHAKPMYPGSVQDLEWMRPIMERELADWNRRGMLKVFIDSE